MEDHLIGIIIHTTEYKEHDLICTLLTNTDERKTIIVKGATKANSKTAGYSMIGYTYDYRCLLNEHRDIYSFKGGSLLKSRLNIATDIIKISLMNVINEIIDKVTYENGDMDGLYDILEFCLNHINNSDNEMLALTLSINMILRKLGVEPYVDGCVLCDDTNISAFSIKDGGFLCERHQQFKDVSFSLNDLKAMRYISKATLNNFDVLKDVVSMNDVLLDCHMNFLIKHAGVRINSYDFLKQLI